MATDMLPVLRAFLLPILDEVRRGTSRLGEWPAGGPWRSRGWDAQARWAAESVFGEA